MLRQLVFAMIIVLIAVGCEPSPQQGHAAPRSIEVPVSRPVAREVQDFLHFTGTLRAKETVEIRPRVTGFLKDMHFKLRARVNAGDLLFSIDARPFQHRVDTTRADIAARRAELAQVEFDFRRIRDLVEQGSASEQELVKATAARDALVAQIDSSTATLKQAELNLEWCSVTAPIAGRISRNMVDAGSIVVADQTVLATISNDDVIYAYFSASEQEVLMYRRRRAEELAKLGKKFDPETAGEGEALLGLMTDADYPHRGVIDYVSPVLSAATGTMEIRARFDNPEALLVPGLFARIRVPASAPREALLVNERAVSFDQGQRFLYVVNSANVVEQRFVELGTQSDGLRAVEKGLMLGERVVVNGLQRVRPGMTVQPNEVAMPQAALLTTRPADDR